LSNGDPETGEPRSWVVKTLLLLFVSNSKLTFCILYKWWRVGSGAEHEIGSTTFDCPPAANDEEDVEDEDDEEEEEACGKLGELLLEDVSKGAAGRSRTTGRDLA
jgi:hypothetical protein